MMISDLKEKASTEVDTIYVQDLGIYFYFKGNVTALLIDLAKGKTAYKKQFKLSDEAVQPLFDSFGNLVNVVGDTLGEEVSDQLVSEESMKDWDEQQDVWEKMLSSITHHPTPQIYLTPTPSSLFHPTTHYQPGTPWYNTTLEMVKSDEAVQRIVKARENRRKSLYNIGKRHGGQRHILVIEAMEFWIQTRQRTGQRYDHLDHPKLMVERLEDMIKVLDDVGMNCQIALATSKELSRFFDLTKTTFDPSEHRLAQFPEFGVVEEHLLIEFRKNVNGIEAKRYTGALKHQPLASYFVDTFLNPLWESIKMRDKHVVKQQLEIWVANICSKYSQFFKDNG